KLEGDIGAVDLNGSFTLRYTGGGVDAEGTVVLTDGFYRFGKLVGTLVAPEIHIFKAKAGLGGEGRHSFRFVAGIAGDGATPSNAPALFVAFGDLYNSQIGADALTLRGRNFVLGGPVEGGIKTVSLNYAKERFGVRGAGLDLGDVPEGATPLLLVIRQDSDVRAVLVRAVRKGKRLKY
ncbi:MAG: hypothetical protein ACYTDY_18230, partial [Planctomycetota bacterium]